MTRKALKSTTAILTAMSLLQPLPSLAQSNPDVSVSDADTQTNKQPPLPTRQEICAEAKITEELECDLHILELEAAGGDAATDAPVEVDTTEQVETEALAAEKAEAEAQAAADAIAQTEANTTAEAEAQATAEAEAQVEASAKADADAQAAADAEALTEANAAVEAEANATAEAKAQADADAKADADKAARAADKAEAQAARAAKRAEARAARAEPAAQAAAEAERKDAESITEPEAEAEAVAAEKAAAQAKADAVATDQAEKDAKAAAAARTEAEPKAEAVAAAQEQQTRSAVPDASAIETLTGAPLEALATEADAETSAEVTTETVTEQTSRSSSEEFKEWSPEDQQRETTTQSVAPKAKSKDGMSDLQKAGLLALGAAVVGAIVLNGQRVEANTGDRVVVVDDDNDYRILKDDDALLRQPGSDVRTQRFSDGSTRTNVLRGDGTEIITIRDSTGRVLRRVLVETDGREYVLFDDTRSFEPVVIRDLPEPAVEDFDYQAASDRDSLRLALLAADRRDIGRSFSLRQVREIHEVRQLSPEINLQNITFTTASSAIQPSQAHQLRQMGMLMRDLIADDPTELFLIEGYTDAIGAPGYNLLLSDRRAESVALALGEYFDVPTENLVVQGYGERFLKIPTQAAERLNRRVAVRRITTLVRESGL